MNTKKILPAFILSLSIFLGTIPLAQSANSSAADNSVYEKLSSYEKVVFGEENTGKSVDKRIQLMEKQLFGKSQKGTVAERLEALSKLVNGEDSSKYFPPIPPVLDRSEFAKDPIPAPTNKQSTAAYDSGSQTIAPPTADSQDRVEGMLREAMKLYSQRKTSEAQKIYQQVLAIDFHNSDANFNLGAIAEDSGDFNAAARYYAAAASSSPGDRDIKDALASVQTKLKNQNSAKAIKPNTPFNSTSTTSESTAALKQIASDAAVSYKKGDFDDAIAKLNYLAKKNPYDANTQFALGQALRGKGNNTEALKHLRAASTLDSKNDLYRTSLNQAEKDYGSSSQTATANNGSGPTGEITPFQGLPASESTDSSDSISQMAGLLRRSMPSMMVGSVQGYGYGSPAMGIGSYGQGMAYPLGTVSGGTRLTRVVGSSLMGAAAGAMSNRGYSGGMTKGAMRGAMYGGLFGLMTGGF